MNWEIRDTLGCTRCEGDWGTILTWRHMVPNCATTLTSYPPFPSQNELSMQILWTLSMMTFLWPFSLRPLQGIQAQPPPPTCDPKCTPDLKKRNNWGDVDSCCKRRGDRAAKVFTRAISGWGWGLKPSAGQCWWSQGGIYRVVFLTGPPYKWLSARPLGNLTIRTFLMGLTMSSDTLSFFRADQ